MAGFSAAASLHKKSMLLRARPKRHHGVGMQGCLVVRFWFSWFLVISVPVRLRRMKLGTISFSRGSSKAFPGKWPWPRPGMTLCLPSVWPRRWIKGLWEAHFKAERLKETDVFSGMESPLTSAHILGYERPWERQGAKLKSEDGCRGLQHAVAINRTKNAHMRSLF